MNHRKDAIAIILTAVSLDIALGIAFGMAEHCGTWRGLYFATTTATTVGYGDVVPHGWLPHVLAVMIMITVIPLFAASFSLFTSGLTSLHIRLAEQKMAKNLEERFHLYLGERPGPG